MHKDIYLNTFLGHVPRLLGQINTNPASKSFGCCDRNYWHNNVTAFPNARYQEAVLTLVHLYKSFDTTYTGHPDILKLINAAISFWVSIQENNGSFNEWYPHEGSYVATAFSSYAVSESLLIMGKELIDDYDLAVQSLEKSANWLMVRSQKGVCNQQSGGLMALYNTYLLTQNEKYKNAVNQYEQMIIACQNKEGWFMEYGGPDIGYLSLTIDYLAKYYSKTGSKAIEQVLSRALDFIINFIHEDGTSGGVYTSRETKYLIPHGFEILAGLNVKAAHIAQVIRKNIKAGRSVSFHSLDDRYFMYIGYTYLQACLDGLENLEDQSLDVPKYLYLQESGLYMNEYKGIKIIANLNKTGAFVSFKEGKRISDSGIIIDGTKRFFSGYLDQNNRVLGADEQGFSVEGNLKVIKENIMTPFKSILLNIFQKTIGRIPGMNSVIKSVLRKMLIVNHKPCEVTLRRTVKFTENGLSIEDKLTNLATFNKIIVGANVSFIYVPSSRWFEIENLNDQPYQVYGPDEIKRDEGCLTIKRTMPASSKNTKKPAFV